MKRITQFTFALAISLGQLTTNAQVGMMDKDSITATFSFPTFTYEVPNGTNRIMILYIMNEYISGLNYSVSSVTYGGQAMTPIASAESPYLLSRSEIQAFFLPESAIEAATDSAFDITYSSNSLLGLSGVYYNAMTIEHVDQTTPVEAVRTNNQVSGTTISASSSISADPNDAIISVVMDGEDGSTYTPSAGFSLVENIGVSNRSSAIGWNSVNSSSSITPSFTSGSTSVRQAFMSFRVNASDGFALPVELTRFDANAQEDGVSLTWQTATEKNAAYFLVERSEDHADWELVAQIEAHGNSVSTRDYETWDQLPMNKTTYYRLLQVDINGQQKVYGPLTVKPSKPTSSSEVLRTYPNPSNGAFQLCAGDERSNVTVFDAYGHAVHQLPVQGCVAVNMSLPAGFYFLSTGEQTHRIAIR